MLTEKHDLIHELPEYEAQIRALKESHAHFAKIYHRYNELDREIFKLEQHGTPTDDAHFEDLKKQRLALKDEAVAMLRDQ